MKITLIAIVSLLSLGEIPGARAPVLVSPLDLSLSCVEDKIKLHMRLTNTETHSVVLPAVGQPWHKNSFSMRYRVFAYGGGSFENVERKLLVEDDFDSSEKILDPGKYLDGDVYISSEFEIQKYIKTKDIVIFWSYDYQLYFGPFLNAQRDGVEKGMIFLPRKGWFSHDCGGIFIDHHSDDSP